MGATVATRARKGEGKTKAEREREERLRVVYVGTTDGDEFFYVPLDTLLHEKAEAARVSHNPRLGITRCRLCRKTPHACAHARRLISEYHTVKRD